MVLGIFWTPKNTCPKSCQKMVGGRPGPGLKIGAGAQGFWPGPGSRLLARAMGPGPWPWAPVLIFNPAPGLPPNIFQHFLGMCFWGVPEMPKTIFSQLVGHMFSGCQKHLFYRFGNIADNPDPKGTRET